MNSPVPQIMEEGLPVVPQERVQNRTPEQIVGVPVPQIIEDSIVDSSVPQIMEELLQNRTPEQIVCVPVPQIMEDGSPVVPQERLQNRTPERFRVSLASDH